MLVIKNIVTTTLLYIKTTFIILGFTLTLQTQLLSADIIVDANTTFITDKDITDNAINIQGDNITFINNHIIKDENASFFGYISAINVNTNKNIKIFNKNIIDISTTSRAYMSIYGIYIRNNISDSLISNSGTIIARDLSGYVALVPKGIRIGTYTADINNTTIINSGNILIESPSKRGTGIEIIAKNIRNLKINNYGTIKGHFYGIRAGSDGVSDAIITNSGTITGDYALYLYFSGTVNNEKSGIINGDVLARGDDLFFTNKGTINLPNLSNSIITNYTQYETGTLGIKLDIDANGDSTHSKVSVPNKAILADGTTIKVDVSATDQASQKFLKKDSVLTGIVYSDNTIDVNTTKLNLTDNSALLNFEAFLSNSDKSLDLKAVEDSTISQAVSKSGHNRRLRSVSKVLDNTDNKLNNSEMRKFMNHLNTLPTNESIANAVTQVTPASLLSTQSLTSQITKTMSSVVDTRQSSLRGLSSGDIAFSDKNIWIKPFGGYTSQDNKDDINGFSANTFGLGFGIDAEYANDKRIGLAMFYTNADVDTNDVDQSSDINSFSLVGYGSNPIVDDKTTLFYQVGLGLQSTNTKRVIVGVGTAKADYTSKNLFFQLKAQKDIEINKSFKAKPALLTSYAYYKNPSYSENGVGGLNLEVQEFSAKSFILGIQSDFTYDIDKDTQLLSNLALSYDFYNDAQSINSTFQGGGTVFSTEGIKNDSLIYKAGIGVIKKLKQNFYIDFKYDFDARGTDFQNHVISSKINYKF